ncbi:MAG TPA: pyrroline-5-carboxylate reductase [Nitrospiria bacterium]|nr:pyrroline-5-carboxylate reductase [Nitrospiria bacterium]
MKKEGRKPGRIAFVGAGNMVEAIIKGILSAGLYKKEEILASDASQERIGVIKERYGVRTTLKNTEAVSHADLIILGVKPLVVDPILKEIREEMKPEKLLVSVVAGTPIGRILAGLDKEAKVIRAMPNTPALVREGATALAPGMGVSPQELAMTVSVFNSIGRTIVLEERYLDAVTGLSGSGPAFVFVVIEALADGGVKMGLTREVALSLAAQTVLGSARMILETQEHPGKLKDMVASPGGTTIAGLHRLEEAGLRAAMIAAVEAATKRSEELGRLHG